MKLFPLTLSSAISKLIIIILFILTCNIAFGQKNYYEPTPQVYSNNDIMSNTSGSSSILYFVDPEILVPNHVSLQPRSYVKLLIDSELGPFEWTKTNVKFNIIPVLSGGVEDITNAYHVSLQVEYNPLANSSNFVDLALHELSNAYGVRVEVISFNTVNVNTGNISQTIN